MTIHQQSVFERWPIEDKSVQSIITSPPYYTLRKYDIPDVIIGGENPDCKHEFYEKQFKTKNQTNFSNCGLKNDGRKEISRISTNEKSKFNHQENVYHAGFCIHCNSWKGQYGLESTPYGNEHSYVEHTRLWAKEAWRVLRNDGIMFLNLGDSYSTQSSGMAQGKYGKLGKDYDKNVGIIKQPKINNYPSKCQFLIPHRVAIGLVDDGWILRNTIIWHKTNAMPESVTDRFSKKYEYIFMFTKQEKYYFDLNSVKKPLIHKNIKNTTFGSLKGTGIKGQLYSGNKYIPPDGKNPGDVFSYSEESIDFDSLSIEEHTTILGINEFDNFFNFISFAIGKLENSFTTMYNRVSMPDMAIYSENISNFFQKVKSSSKIQPNLFVISGYPYATIAIEYSTNKITICFGRNRWVFCNETLPGNNEKIRQPICYLFAINTQSISSPLYILINWISGLPLPLDIINQFDVFRAKAHSDTFASTHYTPITHKQSQDISLMESNFSKIFFIESMLSSAYIIGNTISKKFMVMPTTKIFTDYDPTTSINIANIFHVINIAYIYEKSNHSGDVWTIPTSPSSEKHYAQWPERLVERMVKCSTKAGDTVLDCFAGSGTTGIVAESFHRKFIGIELGYENIHKRRMSKIQKELFV